MHAHALVGVPGGAVFVVVHLLSPVRLCDPRTTAHQGFLFSTISRNLLKRMSIASMIPSNHLILCCPLLLRSQSFPASVSFPSQLFTSGGQSIGTSASAAVIPMNIQD